MGSSSESWRASTAERPARSLPDCEPRTCSLTSSMQSSDKVCSSVPPPACVSHGTCALATEKGWPRDAQMNSRFARRAAFSSVSGVIFSFTLECAGGGSSGLGGRVRQHCRQVLRPPRGVTRAPLARVELERVRHGVVVYDILVCTGPGTAGFRAARHGRVSHSCGARCLGHWTHLPASRCTPRRPAGHSARA